MRVRITKMPLDKAAYGKQVDGSLSLQPGAFGGADYTASDKTFYKGVKDSISAVPREEANLEAEGGETAFGPISGQSIPDHVKINGKRHHEGGVPLNLPDDTFIFSDTASLRINDPSVLAMFNKTPKKGGYTPAEIAKPYNINKYKSILLDPDTSKLERNTATIMIKNYIMKLGALALVQESMKGFPQGIPSMAKPYMEANGISEEDLMPELKEQAEALEQSMQPGVSQPMPQQQNPMMAQEMQQMAPDQAMQAQQMMMNQGQPAYPQQMPSGAPVAMPQQDMGQMAPQGSMPPPEMMQQGMMAYGGSAYAGYGMEMGGYDFPYDPTEMAMGGMPKFDGTENSQVEGDPTRPKNIKIVPKSEYDSSQWEIRRDAQGEYKYNKVTGQIIGKAEAQTAAERQASGRGGGGGNYTKEDVCRWVSDPNNKNYYGWTGLEAFNAGLISEANIAFIDECHKKLEGAGDVEQAIYTETETETPCLCQNADGSVYKDANGNTKPAPKDPNTGECLPKDPSCAQTTDEYECVCEDPVTGEVKKFPVTNMEECNCSGKKGKMQKAMMQPMPHWSKAAQSDVMRNALMQVNPAASNVMLPGRAQVQGAYEEYQTKTDQALAALNQVAGSIMSGTSGSTGKKQAMLKDMLGKGLRASMDAVAGVQSRNVDRQRETNTQQATIDNSNMLARTQLLNQALDVQKGRKDQRTANLNKKIYNTFGAKMAADLEMGRRQNINVTTPQYMSEYDYGFITPTGIEKPLTGAGGQSFEDRIQYYLSKTGDYQKAFDMAYKEARMLKQFGGESFADGGYILAGSMYPFIL
jgi:hypothetical protein